MKLSRLLAAAAAPVLLLGVMTPSYADDVSNNLDNTVDATAEAMSLTVGGASRETTIYVQPRNSDGVQGCNVKQDGTLTLSVTSSNPERATVSPASITLAACGVAGGSAVTVTPVGVGSTTVTVAISANNTGGTFDLTHATFTAIVDPPLNTAPTVTVKGVTSGANYAKGSVPAATCNVTDAQDGPSSFPATLTPVSGPNAAQGIGSQTAKCAHTDSGGLAAAPASLTYNIVPPANAAPTVSISGVADGDSYTKDSVPTAMCNVVDTEDGNSSFAAQLSSVTGLHSAKGIGSQTASCSYTDNGNILGADRKTATASATYTIAPVPNTAPTVKVTGVADGAEYVLGDVPTAECDVTDAEDVDASADVVLTDVEGPFGIFGIGEQTATCSYTDSGNITGQDKLSAQDSVTYTIVPVPNTAPVVKVTGVEDGADYEQNSVPEAACDVTDAEDTNEAATAVLSAITGPYSNVGIGEQTATCSYTDNGNITGQDKQSDQDSVTYNIVPVPNTAPVVEVTGVEDDANYEQGSVPAAKCDVTDAEDTNEAATPVLSAITGPYSNVGIGEQTATCSYTDKGDVTGQDKLDDQDSVTYNIVPVPNTAPVVEVTEVTEGAEYPIGSVPAAKCDVTDAEDTDEAATAVLSDITGPYAVDGIGEQTATCSYTDKGDVTRQDKLSDNDSVTYTIVDPTAPEIDYDVDPTGPNGANGWYIGDVSVDWTVTEDESPSSLDTAGCADLDITSDQVATTYTCSASSAGGEYEVTTMGIKRDATAPSLDFNGGPANGGSYFYGSVPDAPTCSADDNLSGIGAPCVVSGYSSAVGPHTVTAKVKDNAGNETTVSRSYTVKAWTVDGFYAPVDMNGVFNVVKGGSTVPLKFELFSGTAELTSTAAVQSFVTKKVNCTTSAALDEVEMVTTGGTSLRYDTTGGQFIQNWKTPTGAGTCYSATMTAADGSAITAYFKLK